MWVSDRVSPDILRDYLTGDLSEFERQRIERAIKGDREIARAFEMIREGADVIRARLDLNSEIPAEWLTIISRWSLAGKP